MSFGSRYTSPTLKKRSKKIYEDDGNDVTPKPLKFAQIKESIGSKKSSCSLDSQASKSVEDKDSQKSDDILNVDAIAGIYAGYKKENKKCQILGKSEVVLVVRETQTTWLLDINGYVEQQLVSDKESDDIQQQIDDCIQRRLKNKRDCFIQTANFVCKKKAVQTSAVERKDINVFASEWDLYDNSRKLQQTPDSETGQDNVDGDEDASERTFPHSQSSAQIDGRGFNENEDQEEEEEVAEEKRLNSLPAFDNVVLITERLLASNTYTKQQTEFAGFDSQKGGLRSGIHYHMSLLWTFTHEEFANMTVTAISWNTSNQNIVAVGYGKYYFKENVDGAVGCWNVKNPDRPERLFRMKSVVTTLSFSKKKPNLLAVGCYAGTITVFDISCRTGNPVIINRNVRASGPVWDLQWFIYTDFVKEIEEIISIGQTGEVWKWNHEDEHQHFQLMTLQYTPPRLEPMVNKKLDRTEGAVSINVKNMCGLSISVHPGKPMIYYVSTSEGSILKCAVNHPDQAIDIFPGHTGSVYGIKHSPFSNSIFLTYGSDWVVYLWAENINEPLIKLQSIKDKACVEGAKWSPTHSTILASISNNQLSLWDLSRKIIVPMFDIKAPTKKHRSLEFSPSGKNILVGDMDGKVFVYNLTDMPFPPFLQVSKYKLIHREYKVSEYIVIINRYI
ncbi:dynein intermediate chain 4, axonemal [Nilaparvata lugens]|uniref:dynein intermediate chain 4, axonemal n=1 Tax=Nilaparvata lugens TaxID=108931 RepID=UPI00193CDCF1|nr:dynein intermediate chain 4, axonemal [Nilaparvata lugens]